MRSSETARRVLADLPTAMGLLCWRAAPAAWRDAVARAARLLGPSWAQDPDRDRLGVLALLFYALADERAVAVGDVPLEAVRSVLAVDDRGLAWHLERRIRRILDEQGHSPYRDLRSPQRDREESPLWRIQHRLIHVQMPDEPTMMAEPRPSRLAEQVDVLLALLAGTTEAEERLLPEAPLPVGALRVRIDGGRVYRWSGGMVVGAVPVACTPCGTLPGGTVLVDGPDATYLCANGHTARPGLLSAPHVRVAVAHGLDDDGHRAPLLLPEGADIVWHGDLNIAGPGAAEDIDPTAYFIGSSRIWQAR
ncbi:hypothetical protein ACIQI7_32080 [Kitasatospora sp. NPDC092039]|uniref:hypothetical protein n=1 Tax=Kitasatospora sp. NPDC092039 TaxID=3364086 RepID=UPI0038017FE2